MAYKFNNVKRTDVFRANTLTAYSLVPPEDSPACCHVDIEYTDEAGMITCIRLNRSEATKFLDRLIQCVKALGDAL
jgi:hypothetical protein